MQYIWRANKAALLRFIYCLLFVLAVQSSTMQAQSRRAPPRTSAPPVPATPAPPNDQPAPRPTPAPTPRASLVAVYYVSGVNTTIETDTVFRSFMARLQQSAALKVTAGKETRRKDAIDLAKSEKDDYVVWLQLQLDVMDQESATIGPINPSCLYVDYVVFTPVTAKVKAQGRVYQPGVQSRCVGTPSNPSPFPTSSRRLPAEYTLRQAGREAAERVLQTFGVATSPTIVRP